MAYHKVNADQRAQGHSPYLDNDELQATALELEWDMEKELEEPGFDHFRLDGAVQHHLGNSQSPDLDLEPIQPSSSPKGRFQRLQEDPDYISHYTRQAPKSNRCNFFQILKVFCTALILFIFGIVIGYYARKKCLSPPSSQEPNNLHIYHEILKEIKAENIHQIYSLLLRSDSITPLTTGVDNDLLKLRINEGKISEEIANQVYPGVWATDVPGKAKNATPVEVKLKEGRQPVRIKQYPLRKEDREGIRPVIEKFLQLGLLRECESDFNTPILPVRKPDGSYRVVQDLRAINKITEDLYPVVANPYTLLTVLTPELTWFTVLDLKDAFFCLPLHKSSQKIFAFEWENPKRGRKTQLTWTVLPQGFKNSPTIFGNQLAKDLESWEAPPEEGKLLQYVDDILIATKTEDACMTWTVSLLNFLGLQGYRVSKKKAQVMQCKQGIALGILAQDLGPYRRAVAYFSKQLDATAKGWPGCLRAVAAVVLNIQEARKFTLGQKMTVLVSHTVSVVLEAKGGHWLSPQRFLKYQAIMVEQDDVEIIVTNIVNPASFLSGNTGEPVHHDCLETIETTYSSRSDLRDSPMENTENWFTDGSSYVLSGKRHAGYAITTSQEIIE
ncbi:hypothetical protein GRJ2_001837400 [Grus japonensis]|uniref:ribonuclease H n=1 Tax=Grus japonensis TaxID=30415 RepID=A0ABC9X7Q6_GRUJA